MMKRSFSFSLRRLSASTWFALSSSCGVPLRKREAESDIAAASRDFGEVSSPDLEAWRNGTVKSMYLSVHWEEDPRRLPWARLSQLVAGHLENAEWMDWVTLPVMLEEEHRLDWW